MIEIYEPQFVAFIKKEMQQDPAHDFNHVARVVKTAKNLCHDEAAELKIVLPAAYLHDCFTFPKNHPERAKSSVIAAEKAIHFLSEINYPAAYHHGIKHSIIAHSFSANIQPETIEAQVVQDADRLDALGAIGISRCLQVSASFGSALYNSEEPFAINRDLDDKAYTVDHFYTKLFKLADLMNTHSAKIEAEKRVNFMKLYLEQLRSEM